MIPDDRTGYAVDVARGVVHRRYARHARGLQRTRTRAGLRALLGPLEAAPCPACYPPAPEPVAESPAPSRRRGRASIEPVAEGPTLISAVYPLGEPFAEPAAGVAELLEGEGAEEAGS